jgi:hypothetical protein
VVKGPDWGWRSPGVLAAWAVAAASLAWFWRRSHRHPLPVVEPALLRVRAFAWANATAVLFSVAFAAGLLALVLWLQEVWGWSALSSGLAIAPGPLMVPVFAAVAQRLSPRVPSGALTGIGCAVLGLGTLLVSLGVHRSPDYAAGVLPGWLVGGVGVGFALPTIMSAATADLPPGRTATGSAIVTMARQVGFVLGVSLLVAVLGSAHTAGTGYAGVHHAFRHAWDAVLTLCLVAAAAATQMTPSRMRASSDASG